MKLLLLNGPPRSGKDHAARMLVETDAINCPVLFDRMSAPLKLAFAGFMGVPYDDYLNVEPYEGAKGNPILIFKNHMSYREWQIWFSEECCKPKLGETIFTKLLLMRLQDYSMEYPSGLVVIPDCGFQIEIDTLISEFPPSDIALWRIHRSGTSYDGDSRSYVTTTNPEVDQRDITNAGDQTYNDEILRHTLEFLKR